MKMKKDWIRLFVLGIFVIILASCAPAAAVEPAQPNDVPAMEEPAGEASEGQSSGALPTQGADEVVPEEPTLAPTTEEGVTAPEKTASYPTPTPVGGTSENEQKVTPTVPQDGTSQPLPEEMTSSAENRYLEFEYPQTLFYGDSDVIRLSLIPVEDGYVIESEFPDHTTSSEPVKINRPDGYQLIGVAVINSLGFGITPAKPITKTIPEDQEVHWRWTILADTPGSHRMNINLTLRWEPTDPAQQNLSEDVEIFSKAFEINVRSFLGLNRRQSFVGGFGSLFISIFTGLFAALYRSNPLKRLVREILPDQQLIIEAKPEIRLSERDDEVLRAMFSGYRRILVERQFLSGYSGAKTLLILPILPDGKRDAETIVKIGVRESIQREYDNYQAYVKHSLPPITARIQNKPVSTKSSRFAAIMYTFVAEPGEEPKSLGALLKTVSLSEESNLVYLEKLFLNFGPNWWYQSTPYIYRLTQEFDKKLPSHFTVVPEENPTQKISGYLDEDQFDPDIVFKTGDLVSFGKFSTVELRGDGDSYTLIGKTKPGFAPLRIRWESSQKPKPMTVRVIKTREETYREYQTEFELYNLPDPWERLKSVEYERVEGRKSVIHGDLNLENILIGAAGLVWMIDFSETREGPPVFDLAHLAVELVAHVYSKKIENAAQFLLMLKAGELTYLSWLETIAARCVKPETDLREYRLALLASGLGAIKYENLNQKARHFLYVFAAFQAEKINPA